MTTSRESRHEQVERLRRLIREHEERIARRDRAAFEDALAALVQRVSTRPPPPPPEPDPKPVTRALPRTAPTDGDVWWSNTPVLGYRIWELKQGRLHGAWTPWEASKKTAVCLDKHSRARGPVPHDASECRPPPCGIYALKGTRKVQRMVEQTILKTSVPVTLAIGLVAMSGRVVEHEHGYRAEHVEVLALAMVTGAVGKHTVLATIEGRDEVAFAFEKPKAARSRVIHQTMTPKDAVAAAIRFLRDQETRAG